VGLHLSSSGVPLCFAQGQLFPLFKKVQKVYICILVTFVNFVLGINEQEGHWQIDSDRR